MVAQATDAPSADRPTTRMLVDTQSMPWQGGLDVIGTMAKEFRDNLGPADQLAECYAKYRQKTLRIDPVTTRRIDLIHLSPGYKDLTFAFHDSAEECFVIDGSITIGGEGDLASGDYFWRPPGWIHAAWTSTGFTALLGLQGRNGEESGPASRRIRPDDQAGRNALYPEEGEQAMGPRGWVRRCETGLLRWLSGPEYARTQGTLDGFDLDHLRVKTLSQNATTGDQTLLIELLPGYQQPDAGRSTVAIELFVINGSLTIGTDRLRQGGYLYWPADLTDGPTTSASGALLYAKIDGWLDFQVPGRR